jgi:hypothetical protein
MRLLKFIQEKKFPKISQFLCQEVENFHQKKNSASNMVLVIWVQDEFNRKYAA